MHAHANITNRPERDCVHLAFFTALQPGLPPSAFRHHNLFFRATFRPRSHQRSRRTHFRGLYYVCVCCVCVCSVMTAGCCAMKSQKQFPFPSRFVVRNCFFSCARVGRQHTTTNARTKKKWPTKFATSEVAFFAAPSGARLTSGRLCMHFAHLWHGNFFASAASWTHYRTDQKWK